MNLKQLSDQTLLSETESLVKTERETLTMVLHHLREIEARKLFSSLGFKSLFEYAVKKLGYSDDQAFRRISAMRLLKEIPEIEQKLEVGSLTLSNVSKAQTLFRKENLAPEEKLEVLKQLENKSSREAEKIILENSTKTESVKPDKVKLVADDLFEIRFSADQALVDKIDKLKGLLAHSMPHADMNELFSKALDIALEKLDPAREPKKRNATGTIKVRVPKQNSRSIPLSLKRLVWQKGQGRCQKCQSTHALQVDHCFPWALGGRTEFKNLRLLCRNCNQRYAVEQFGIQKLNRYLNKNQSPPGGAVWKKPQRIFCQRPDKSIASQTRRA